MFKIEIWFSFLLMPWHISTHPPSLKCGALHTLDIRCGRYAYARYAYACYACAFRMDVLWILSNQSNPTNHFKISENVNLKLWDWIIKYLIGLIGFHILSCSSHDTRTRERSLPYHRQLPVPALTASSQRPALPSNHHRQAIITYWLSWYIEPHTRASTHLDAEPCGRDHRGHPPL